MTRQALHCSNASISGGGSTVDVFMAGRPSDRTDNTRVWSMSTTAERTRRNDGPYGSPTADRREYMASASTS